MLILLGYDQYGPGRGVTSPRSGSVLTIITNTAELQLLATNKAIFINTKFDDTF